MNILSQKNIHIALVFITSSFFLICLYFIQFIYYIPNYKVLKRYAPTQITRLYDVDGSILDEYAREKRVYIKYEDIPKIIINSFIAVEDKNFFNHQGVDLISSLRAFLYNLINIHTQRRLVGGSTITQQVVKGLFLTNERNITRKIKEVIVSHIISNNFSKKKILEIYLNHIYLGNNSYGIFTAAYNYFGKSLAQINIEEAALLASLPKAPSDLNPYKNYNRSLTRRNWAIQRIKEEGYITLREQSRSIRSTIKLKNEHFYNSKKENYYTTIVKSELIKLFGEENIYSKGFIVNTNLNPKIQSAVKKGLKDGLRKYDKEQGFRKIFSRVDLNRNFLHQLNAMFRTNCHYEYSLAAVTKINTNSLDITLYDNTNITLLRPSFEWILSKQDNITEQLKKLFTLGDVILIKKTSYEYYTLEQIPEINGAIVVIENISGKVLSLIGGYDYCHSKFNRATQARRQPGSTFKTFVYIAAFQENIAPNTLILDAPFEIYLGYGLPPYKPKNYSDKYYGLITLRTSFEKSRNLSTIRLLLGVGLEKLSMIAKQYLIYNDNIHSTYSMTLGSYETTLLKITNAYASIANNGLIKKPKLIDSIYDRNGKLLYKPQDTYQNYIGCINNTMRFNKDTYR